MPRTDVFVFQPGGLGDVVLTSQLIAALKRAEPDRRIILGVDAAFDGLPELFPIPPDDVFSIDMQPLVSLRPGRELYQLLRGLRAQLDACTVGRFVGAALRPSWLSFFVAAVLHAESNVFSAPLASSVESDMLRTILNDLALAEPITTGPFVKVDLPEPKRYAALARFITGSVWPPVAWSVARAARVRVLEWLATNGMRPQQFVVCFPFVSGTTVIKAWPVEHFVSVLNDVAARAHLGVVIIGAGSEASAMRAAADALHVPSAVCSGFDFAFISGLIAHARAFVGNDTGPAHLAQALGLPGVVIFGGGYWPVYAPWAGRVTAVIHTLPCFGCNWDCPFEHAFCVHRIPESVVSAQLLQACGPSLDDPRVVDTGYDDPVTDDIIARATQRYRSVTRAYSRIGNELLNVQREADRRALALEDVSSELDMVRREADRRALALEAMQRELLLVSGEADRRALALEEMQQELILVSREAERRAEALQEMQRELSHQDGRTRRLRLQEAGNDLS